MAEDTHLVNHPTLSSKQNVNKTSRQLNQLWLKCSSLTDTQSIN